MAPRAPFAAPSSYDTQLSPLYEMMFRTWVDQNKVPFNPDAQGPTDYDMRGYWQGLQQGNPQASLSSLNSNDGRMHYPDYYKTPLHQSFSNESQWAGPTTPQWVDESRLSSLGGRIVFDEKQPRGLLDQFMSLRDLGSLK